MSKDESDQETEKRIDDPIPVSGIGSRVRMVVDALGSRKAAAKAAGVGEDMIYRYLRGENDPSLSAAAALARASGYSLQWIILGEGPMKTGAEVTHQGAGYTSPARDSVNLIWLEEAITKLEQYLEERCVTRPPAVKAQIIARLYEVARTKELIEKNDLVGLLDLF